jgi:hypothetical protein
VAERALSVEAILGLLAAAPERLGALAKGATPAQLVDSPAPGQWSTRDVLAHLRACADMWGGAIVTILSEDRPTFRAVNPTTWIRQTRYLELPFFPSLKAYTQQRVELLTVLRPLPPAAWERSSTVTGAGKPIERTVFSYAQWLATHERSHDRQVMKLSSAWLPAPGP